MKIRLIIWTMGLGFGAGLVFAPKGTAGVVRGGISTYHTTVDLFWWIVIAAVITVAGMQGTRHGYTWRYPLAPSSMKHALKQAARIRREWPSLAVSLGLVLEKAPKRQMVITGGSRRNQNQMIVQMEGRLGKRNLGESTTQVPKIRVRADKYGVIVHARAIPRVGLVEWQAASAYISDAWDMERVSITRPKPGLIRVRAVSVDPLSIPLTYESPDTVDNLEYIYVGVDEYGELVPLRVKNVSGTGVYGLPGFGKTSFILGMMCSLAPSEAVQFIGFDGKVTSGRDGDYSDVADRFLTLIGDDIGRANRILTQLCDFRAWRSSNIRECLGVKNIWHVGPSPDWPLVVVLIDECHTYFDQQKGSTREVREANALRESNARLTSDLIRKGRSVGIWVVVATQKGTTDAVPSIIRDNCPTALSFALKTSDAAEAALGADIRKYPDANPVSLQSSQYVGVASMTVEGSPGFTRFRSPYCEEDVAIEMCRKTAYIVSLAPPGLQAIARGV